jgi:uncharacterized protein
VDAWARDALDSHPVTAHDWLHVQRVRRLAVGIAREEGVDPWLAAVAATIHDVGRASPGPGAEHGLRSSAMAAPLLAELGLAIAEQQAVLHAVRWHNSGRSDTPLLCVLRDADMLDGMGAIGLMRALMSKHMLPPYESEALFDGEPRRPAASVADQVRFQMEWMGWMNTDAGRRLAKGRYEFMRLFADQVRAELGDGCDE